MSLPGEADRRRLQKLGDPELDPLLDEFVVAGQEEALARLLSRMFTWMPGTPFPSSCDGVPAGILSTAKSFVEKDDVFGGAFGAKAIDWARVGRAQAFYDRHQALGMLILGCGSLPACYSIPGVALVLMGSGKLALQVRMRLMETIAFLTVVMKPGSLGPGGNLEGNRWVRKVRLMHGLMRCLMLADPQRFNHLADDQPANALLKLDWAGRSGSDDFPIDQVELGFVLLTFSWMVVRGYDSLGVKMTAEEKDDHVYAWAVIGHGLGIEPVMRPETAASARELFEELRDRYEDGTEEGRLLAASLIVYIIFRLRQGIREMLPPAVLGFLLRHFKRFGAGCLESLARTFVRLLTGEDTANKLWVPRAPLLHWLAGLVVRLGLVLKDTGKAGDKGLPRLLGAQFSAARYRQ